MKRAVTICCIGALSLLLFATPGRSEMGTIDETMFESNATVNLHINPVFVFAGAEHVANGVALRNAARGTIALRGIPLGSTVVKAYLYWNFSNMSAVGVSGDYVFFDGNLAGGIKVADSPDPCWGMSGNHTYRADVTGFIPSIRPNGDYEFLRGGVSTSGQNPFVAETQTTRMEGATLVVVYKNASTTGNTVSLYDSLSGSTFSNATGTFTLNHSARFGSGLFTMCGADGQRTAYTNSASNEKGTFNGTQFSGPPVAASDWDGSAGWPLVQLWDVHTHQVTLNGTTSVVVYTAGSDCLVPVLYVIQSGL